MLTWLHLEDQIPTIERAVEKLDRAGILRRRFQSIGQLVDFLVDSKEKNDLSSFGLILDIMLVNTPFIHIPKEWSGLEKDEFFNTQGDYSAGLSFYENFILNMNNIKNNKPFWNPPPATIFLTILGTEYKDNKQRFLRIQNKWLASRAHLKDKRKEASVEWINKWSAEDELLATIESFQKINEYK